MKLTSTMNVGHGLTNDREINTQLWGYDLIGELLHNVCHLATGHTKRMPRLLHDRWSLGTTVMESVEVSRRFFPFSGWVGIQATVPLA